MNFSKTQTFILILIAILILGLPLLGVLIVSLPFVCFYFCWNKSCDLRNTIHRRKLDFELVLQGKLDLTKKRKNVPNE